MIEGRLAKWHVYVTYTQSWTTRKVVRSEIVHTSLIMNGVEYGPNKSWGELSRKRCTFGEKTPFVLWSHHHFHHPYFPSPSSSYAYVKLLPTIPTIPTLNNYYFDCWGSALWKLLLYGLFTFVWFFFFFFSAHLFAILGYFSDLPILF